VDNPFNVVTYWGDKQRNKKGITQRRKGKKKVMN
jgi:hypothetical protein